MVWETEPKTEPLPGNKYDLERVDSDIELGASGCSGYYSSLTGLFLRKS